VYHWDPGRGGPPAFARLTPLDTPHTHVARALAHDASGALWIATDAALLRRREGRWARVPPQPALPGDMVRAFWSDRRGRFWLALRYNGATVVEDPGQPGERLRNYTVADGLASNAVRTITEDAQGRIYLGTHRGVDRLDPATGAVGHYDSAHGLADDWVYDAFTDRRGRIWLATADGATLFDPTAVEQERRPPPVYVVRVQVSGETLALPERGVLAVPHLDLAAVQNNVRVEVAAPHFSGQAAYQFRLQGVERDWGPLVREPVVQYARLGAGGYRLQARAITPEGVVSDPPAEVSFAIAVPWWRSVPFLVLVLALAVSGGLALHRLRLRRVLAIEGLRRQIASDLHDEVGSGLAQIAVQSELAGRDAQPAAAGRMQGVAGLARGLRESMSDIVWAIDPRKDRLADLVQRMRMAAFDLAESDGLRVDFESPAEDRLQATALSPDRKRHLLLAFKEALTNVVRHAAARHVRVRLRLDGSAMELEVTDDGRGFDPAAAREGMGLHSLARRAEETGGRLALDSAPQRGTTVRLAVPLRGRAARARTNV
jgi:signal transduction histidine kinase